jgi:hypothetical protein
VPPIDERARFVDAFTAGWALGQGADGFVAHFVPEWIDPDVTLVQPMAKPTHGLDGFRRFADRTFGVMPDLVGEVEGWRPTDDGVEIDCSFRGTLGRRRVTFKSLDVITLRDGRLVRREAKLQLAPLLLAAATSPSAALALAELVGLRRRRARR